MSDQGTFTAFVPDAEDAEWDFDWPKQLKAFYRRYAGDEVDVTVSKRGAAKTLEQIRGFHAMIAPWARDEGHRIDDLKWDLMGEIFGWSEKASPLTGRLVPLRQHTSDLSRADYSILIERTLEIAAGTGYVLEAPSEWKARKQAEQQTAETRARQAERKARAA